LFTSSDVTMTLEQRVLLPLNLQTLEVQSRQSWEACSEVRNLIVYLAM